MHSERHRIFSPKRYISILLSLFFGVKLFFQPRDLRARRLLYFDGFVLILVLNILAPILRSRGDLDWQLVLAESAPGVALGLAIGATLGIAVRFNRDLSKYPEHFADITVAGAALIGISFGFAGQLGAIAGGVIFGVMFSGALGFPISVVTSITLGFAGGGAAGMAKSTYRFIAPDFLGIDPVLETGAITVGFVASVLIAAFVFFVGLTLALGFQGWVARWQPSRLWVEVLVSGVGLLGLSFVSAGFFSAVPEQLPLFNEVTVTETLVIMFLCYTRLPLWPIEVSWGNLVMSRLNRLLRNGDISISRFIASCHFAYYDRYMFIPLPGEASAFCHLAEKDLGLAIREAVDLLLSSNHIIQAIFVLRRFAEQDPLHVRACVVSQIELTYDQRYLGFIELGLQRANRRAWRALKRIQDVSGGLVSGDGELVSPDPGARTELIRELQTSIRDFEVVRKERPLLQNTLEFLELYRAVALALEAQTLYLISSFRIPRFPSNCTALYPQELMSAVDRLYRISLLALGYERATSPVTKGRHVLEALETIESSQPLLDAALRIGQPFPSLIITHWRSIFVAAGGRLARGGVSGPFAQPYVIANPVVGAGFVGREDVLRRLETLWVVKGQRPSVVLYGHRRMGKSSILQNLKGEQFGGDTQIVDFNLQTYGLVPSTGHLLHNLALELYDAAGLSRVDSSLSEPRESLFRSEPYGAFSRFLRRLHRRRTDWRFVVTMDEFETLEGRIHTGKLQGDLIDYLRGVITTQTWLTIAFAGLHTLREMTQDYWNPLFGSVETIPVSFLSEGATRRLLTAPAPDFGIDYSEEAIELVYELTHGQPYLTQLVGHALVSGLNKQMFEEQIEREARFGRGDVEAVIADEAFYRTGSAYFQGIWAQAAQGPAGQQAILGVLAAGAASRQEIAAATGLPEPALDEACDCLERHDMITVGEDRRHRCTVELMRRWLGQQQAILVAQDPQ